MDFRVSRAEARTLFLAAQGLEAPPTNPTSADVLAAIRRMAVLQIDTIHVVARSPYLVLWSRLGAYEPRWLDELLEQRQIFEYWAHEACFLPIEDFPIYRRRMLDYDGRAGAYVRRWLTEHHADAEQMLDYIRARGEVRSSDFTRTDGQSGTWWNWKPEKHALEMLFILGEVMIARRERFQRIYDLRERIMTEWHDDQALSSEVARRELALRAVRALGVARRSWVADYFRTRKAVTEPLLPKLAAEGALLTGHIEGWNEPAYLHPDHQATLAAVQHGSLAATRTTLLSPFDPVVWDRRRALELFGFDYRIECYTPAPKRRYGYFTLPILHRGNLVGRLDAKAHRSSKHFEVKALHLEPGVPLDDTLATELAAALNACAAWHQTPHVTITHCEPPEFGPMLEQAL